MSGSTSSGGSRQDLAPGAEGAGRGRRSLRARRRSARGCERAGRWSWQRSCRRGSASAGRTRRRARSSRDELTSRRLAGARSLGALVHFHGWDSRQQQGARHRSAATRCRWHGVHRPDARAQRSAQRRGRIVARADDPSLTGHGGLAVIGDLELRLGLIAEIDRELSLERRARHLDREPGHEGGAADHRCSRRDGSVSRPWRVTIDPRPAGLRKTGQADEDLLVTPSANASASCS